MNTMADKKPKEYLRGAVEEAKRQIGSLREAFDDLFSGKIEKTYEERKDYFGAVANTIQERIQFIKLSKNHPDVAVLPIVNLEDMILKNPYSLNSKDRVDLAQDIYNIGKKLEDSGKLEDAFSVYRMGSLVDRDCRIPELSEAYKRVFLAYSGPALTKKPVKPTSELTEAEARQGLVNVLMSYSNQLQEKEKQKPIQPTEEIRQSKEDINADIRKFLIPISDFKGKGEIKKATSLAIGLVSLIENNPSVLSTDDGVKFCKTLTELASELERTGETSALVNAAYEKAAMLHQHYKAPALMPEEKEFYVEGNGVHVHIENHLEQKVAQETAAIETGEKPKAEYAIDPAVEKVVHDIYKFITEGNVDRALKFSGEIERILEKNPDALDLQKKAILANRLEVMAKGMEKTDQERALMAYRIADNFGDDYAGKRFKILTGQAVPESILEAKVESVKIETKKVKEEPKTLPYAPVSEILYESVPDKDVKEAETVAKKGITQLIIQMRDHVKVGDLERAAAMAREIRKFREERKEEVTYSDLESMRDYARQFYGMAIDAEKQGDYRKAKRLTEIPLLIGPYNQRISDDNNRLAHLLERMRRQVLKTKAFQFQSATGDKKTKPSIGSNQQTEAINRFLLNLTASQTAQSIQEAASGKGREFDYYKNLTSEQKRTYLAAQLPITPSIDDSAVTFGPKFFIDEQKPTEAESSKTIDWRKDLKEMRNGMISPKELEDTLLPTFGDETTHEQRREQEKSMFKKALAFAANPRHKERSTIELVEEATNILSGQNPDFSTLEKILGDKNMSLEGREQIFSNISENILQYLLTNKRALEFQLLIQCALEWNERLEHIKRIAGELGQK